MYFGPAFGSTVTMRCLLLAWRQQRRDAGRMALYIVARRIGNGWTKAPLGFEGCGYPLAKRLSRFGLQPASGPVTVMSSLTRCRAVATAQLAWAAASALAVTL